MAELLTDRQSETLLAVAETGSIKEAAQKLGISDQTVKNHLGLILKVTGSKTSLQAYHRLVKGVKVATTTEMYMEVEE